MKRLCLLLLPVMCSTGCSSFLYELQPHRLWRLNYQDPPGRTDGVLFSVDDPLPRPAHSQPLLPPAADTDSETAPQGAL